MDPTIRPYDPDTDRDAFWALKTGFERGLGAGTGGDEKAKLYDAKLDDEYREGYLEWVERCLVEEPRAVTVAAVEPDAVDGEKVPMTGQGTQLVGYVFVLPESLAYIWDSAVLNEIYVTPDCRGTGVADGLMDGAIEVAQGQELPLERLVLDVDRENDRARSFYERHGFAHWGEMVARSLE
ncbi:GNAT family N-acetyltransferase [Halobacteria archaeon AArc-curdl1]|uniref:GNAT family N-acetyltransferase n=1 Tax=Natronosalvus hydrolyticus TaxID=2979988 RepID=A0AAP2ZAZ9_9EURY|nr:GNAT family N-acetyltransferase [Halobacteria archaeon AArc-curdl1]